MTPTSPRTRRRIQVALGALVAIAIFAVMAFTITDVDAWRSEPTTNSTAAANDQASLVDTLFEPQVIALEVLGVLLTAAMIGALVIARPLDAVDDDSHYTEPTPQQVAHSDNVSDVKAHAAANPRLEGPQ